MSIGLSDVKGTGGWFVAAAAAIWRVLVKVDEGKLYDALNRIEGKVDALDAKVDGLSIDVARMQEHEGGNGGTRYQTRSPRIPIR